jgi:hypothetical protein
MIGPNASRGRNGAAARRVLRLWTRNSCPKLTGSGWPCPANDGVALEIEAGKVDYGNELKRR